MLNPFKNRQLTTGTKELLILGFIADLWCMLGCHFPVEWNGRMKLQYSCTSEAHVHTNAHQFFPHTILQCTLNALFISADSTTELLVFIFISTLNTVTLQ